MAKDAELGSATSSTTRSAENLPLDIAEDVEVGGNSDGSDDETLERSPLFKKLNRPMGYLTSLRSDVDSTSFTKR